MSPPLLAEAKRAAPAKAAQPPQHAAPAAHQTSKGIVPGNPTEKTETINFGNRTLSCREFVDGPKKSAVNNGQGIERDSVFIVWSDMESQDFRV